MYPALHNYIMSGDQTPSYNSTTMAQQQYQPYTGYSIHHNTPNYPTQPYQSYPIQQPSVENQSYQSLSASHQVQQYAYQNAAYQHAGHQHANYHHTYYQYDSGIPSPDVLNQISSQAIQNLSQCSVPSVSSSRPAQRPVKPPYSYAALMCMAINSTAEKKATMREILAYIEQNFPYYRSNKKWHGTIRHDLTVNDCFVKCSPRPGQKGCLWSVHPEFQDMFSKTSFRRRRYRFKEGSTSWRKSRKESAAKMRRKSKQVCDDAAPLSITSFVSQNTTISSPTMTYDSSVSSVSTSPSIALHSTPVTSPQSSSGYGSLTESFNVNSDISCTKSSCDVTLDDVLSSMPRLQWLCGWSLPKLPNWLLQ